jgi:hypothetical protein
MNNYGAIKHIAFVRRVFMSSSVFKKAIASVFASLFVIIASSCTPLDGKVLLSFKYMAISYSSEIVDFTFIEDNDYPNLIATYEVDKHHIISEEDLSSIDLLTSFVPHNNGGYYVRTMYYSEALNPSISNQLTEGYICLSDTVFYYSYTGGIAQPPETAILH